MPTYAYQCALCGARKEIAHSYLLGDIVEPKCEKCNVEMMRVYEAPAVHYKGDGWYNVDKYKPEKT